MHAKTQSGIIHETRDSFKKKSTHWHIKVTLLPLLLSLLLLQPAQYAKSTKSCSVSRLSLSLALTPSLSLWKKVLLWGCQLSQGHPEQRRFSPLCVSSSHPSLSHLTLSFLSHSDSRIIQTSHLFAPPPSPNITTATPPPFPFHFCFGILTRVG